MIKINGEVVNIEKFPDGTPRINIDCQSVIEDTRFLHVLWNYESNDELMYLVMIKRHLDTLRGVEIDLTLPYIPNGRMDRIKSENEVFTLKYFCEIINSLNFKYVFTLDNHSDVSTALLNNCVNDNPKEYIEKAIQKVGMRNLVLYFPDNGAAKRYSDLFSEIPYCYGEKKREWKTGKILGLEIKTNGIDLSDKAVLMIDDIIAYGGSLHYSALELKNLGVNEIYAYATHTENSILDKEKGTLIKDLENNTVKGLFTTNSLFNGNHEKITIMEV